MGFANPSVGSFSLAVLQVHLYKQHTYTISYNVRLVYPPGDVVFDDTKTKLGSGVALDSRMCDLYYIKNTSCAHGYFSLDILPASKREKTLFLVSPTVIFIFYGF